MSQRYNEMDKDENDFSESNEMSNGTNENTQNSQHDEDIDMKDTENEYSESNNEEDSAEPSNDDDKIPLSVNVVCISDTHDHHKGLTKKLKSLVKEDSINILLHAGDMTETGSKRDLLDFKKWFISLPYDYKICISGNMDGLKLEYDINGHKLLNDVKNNLIYLENEGVQIPIPVKNNKTKYIKIYGIPYTTRFYGGFQFKNDGHEKQIYSKIPKDTDILLIHQCPYKILDESSSGRNNGSKVLSSFLLNKKILGYNNLKYCIFGHVHYSGGKSQYDKVNDILCINAAQNDYLLKDNKHIKPLSFNYQIKGLTKL